MNTLEDIEKKQNYKNTFYGFHKDVLSEISQKLEIRQVILLREIILMNKNTKLFSIYENKGQKRFVWISYKVLLDKFSGMHYTMKMLKFDLNILEQHNLIERRITYAKLSKRIYFYITEKTRNMWNFTIQM